MACLKKVDYSKLLNYDSEIKSDVSFVIYEEVNNVKVKTEPVKAHRFLLAAVSPVFQKQFYGSRPDTQDTIPVEETTREAFCLLIDIIYKDDGYSRLESKSFETLFEVLNLASKYMMEDAKKIINNTLETVVLTKDNVMEAAQAAENFPQFEEASKHLFEKCGEVLPGMFKTVYDIATFLANDTEDKIDARLFKKMLASILCSNKPKVFYRVASSGAGALLNDNCMGDFYPTSESINKFPIYKYGTAYLSVTSSGKWIIGSTPGKDAGWIKHDDTNPTPHVPPTTGWLYGNSWKEDKMLSVTSVPIV